jgi:hypothetical protein
MAQILKSWPPIWSVRLARLPTPITPAAQPTLTLDSLMLTRLIGRLTLRRESTVDRDGGFDVSRTGDANRRYHGTWSASMQSVLPHAGAWRGSLLAQRYLRSPNMHVGPRVER